MLALLCLTVSSAWAQSFNLRDGDTWDEDTKTLYVNTDFDEDEEGAYEGYDEIEHVIIAYAVTRIGGSTFSECLNLTSVTIPGRVTTIGDYAFEECENLTSVSIPSSVTTIGDGAFSYTGLTSVTIPGNEENWTEIGMDAFRDCDNLTTVTIGNGVRNIRSGAFGGDALEKFIVYSESVDYWVFGGTDGEESVFEGQGDYTIYVFSNLVDDFKTNEHPGDDRYGWKVYADRIEAIPDLTAISDGAGNYWATYYNEFADVQMPVGTQVFKVALEGSGITLTEISDRIVKAGEGVVLKSNSESITLASALESTGDFTGNSLTGTMTEIENPGNAYVLTTGAQGTGFYKLGSGETIGANVAYLTYDGSEDFLGFAGSAPATVATTFTLAAGDNLVSFNNDATLDDLKSALVAALPGVNGIVINSQSEGWAVLDNGQWRGSLGSLDATQMYMISVPSDCEITLEGMPVDPSEHAVTICNGFTWLGYQLSENMTPTNAFAGFAVIDDKIMSQTAIASYNRGRWSGALSTLEPGKGYIYLSTSSENRTLVFPSAASRAFSGSWSSRKRVASHWPDFDFHQYQLNKPLVAAIKMDGEFATSSGSWSDLEVAAFVGDECRGRALLETGYGDLYPVIEMPIYYNNTDETVTFKVYVNETECELADASEIVTGESHVAYFNGSEPGLSLNFSTPAPTYPVTIDDSNVDTEKWTAAPNPAEAGQTVTLNYTGKKKVKSITIEKAAE